MARISGVDLPNNKQVRIALTYIYGVGEPRALKILEKAGMTGCNPSATPMELKLKLLKEGDTPSVDATEYRSIIGSLRYLCNSRPDLAYAVGYLSRFMEGPHQEHLAAVKRVLRYVAGTQQWGCITTQARRTPAFPSCWDTRTAT